MPYISQPAAPIAPDSFTGIYRTSLALVDSIRSNPAGPVCSSLILLIWASYLYELGFPGDSPFRVGAMCVSKHSVEDPVPFLRNLVTPDSFFRLVLLTAILSLQSVTLERQVGSVQLLGILLGNLLGLSVLFSVHFNQLCFPGTEALGPLLASLTAMLHGLNVRVFTEGLSARVRLPFAVEPRWHCWALLLLYTMTADIDTLLVYALAILIGGVPYISQLGQHLKRFPSSQLINFSILFASIYLLPFSVSSLRHIPFDGPTTFFHRAAIVRDRVSLAGIHCLLASPFFLLAQQRVRSLLLIPIILAWVYCTQSPLFVFPGPAFAGFGFVAYRLVLE